MMSKNNQPIPDWLFDCVQEVRDLFGLGGVEWSFCVKLSDKPGGRDNWEGSAATDYQYLDARLEFTDCIKPGNDAREAVLHEVGHVAHAEIDGVVDMILRQLDDERRSHFTELYTGAVERYLQRLSRALVYNIRPKEEDGKTDLLP